MHNLNGLVEKRRVNVLLDGFYVFGTGYCAFGEVVVDVLCGYRLERGEVGEAPKLLEIYALGVVGQMQEICFFHSV